MQKYLYLQAFYWVYDNKYITETQSYIFNSLLGLADVVIACEALLTKSNKDPNFQLQYLVKNKAQRLSPMEELMALLKDKSISAHPAFNSNSNGNCKNPECNLKGPSKHVPAECWIKYPEKMPQRMKDIRAKPSSNSKFNSNSVNQTKSNADKWKNSPNVFKKETAKAMVSIRQSGEFTNFFGKNLALSYQNKEKHRFSKRMWPFGQKTHTHTQVKSPPSDPCAI